MDDKKLDLQLIDGKRVLGSTVYKIAANMSPETRNEDIPVSHKLSDLRSLNSGESKLQVEPCLNPGSTTYYILKCQFEDYMLIIFLVEYIFIIKKTREGSHIKINEK